MVVRGNTEKERWGTGGWGGAVVHPTTTLRTIYVTNKLRYSLHLRKRLCAMRCYLVLSRSSATMQCSQSPTSQTSIDQPTVRRLGAVMLLGIETRWYVLFSLVTFTPSLCLEIFD